LEKVSNISLLRSLLYLLCEATSQ